MEKIPVRYHVLHETFYDYGSPVSLSQQQLHLSPRILAWQQIEEQRIEIVPQPSWRRDGQDAFGNPVTWIAFHAPHDSLRISSAMTIAITPHLPENLETSLPWETVRDRLAYDSAPPLPEDLDAVRFLFESAHVRIKHELAAYAADCFPPDTPVLVGAQARGQAIPRPTFELGSQPTKVRDYASLTQIHFADDAQFDASGSW